MERPGKGYIQFKLNGIQRFIGFCDVEHGYGRCRSHSRHDRIIQVSKSFTDINEAEIGEKYL